MHEGLRHLSCRQLTDIDEMSPDFDATIALCGGLGFDASI